MAIHPFLFALYPILFLLAHNSLLDLTSDVIVSGLLILLATGFLLLTLLPALKSVRAAAIVTSTFWALFFSFGYLFEVGQYWEIGGFRIVRPSYLIAMDSLIIAGIFISVIKSKKLGNITKALNVVGVALILLNVLTLVSYKAGQSYNVHEAHFGEAPPQIKQATNISSTTLPDIYYIILDAYGREDTLQKYYDYDNSEFIAYLNDVGFYVADQSHSNYEMTVLSLSSSLNMNYLAGIKTSQPARTLDTLSLTELVRENRVSEMLKNLGYKTVSFHSGHTVTEVRNADYYMTTGIAISEFQNLLLNMTPLPWLGSVMSRIQISDGISLDAYAAHRQKLLAIFNNLTKVPAIKEPTFSFAHILCPRHPYVFGPNGESRRPEKDMLSFIKGEATSVPDDVFKRRYKDQLTYINKITKDTIDKILARSETPPIIIIQGDHGPGRIQAWDGDFLNWKGGAPNIETWDNPSLSIDNLSPDVMQDRFSIFNVYFVPDSTCQGENRWSDCLGLP